jgi:hypothetical protein
MWISKESSPVNPILQTKESATPATVPVRTPM